MLVGRQYYADLKLFHGKFKELSKQTRIPTLLLELDCVLCGLFEGSNVAQYFLFQFYRKSIHEKSTYVTAERSRWLRKRLNSAARGEKEANKHEFNRSFGKYVHRAWIYEPEATVDEIAAFLRDNKEVMVKPPDLSKGRGIYKIEAASMDDAALALRAQELKGSGVLLEAFIRQHPEIAAVNPSSVNTIRICTVRDGSGGVHIIGASLRAGGENSVVDNLHAGGVQYPVDVKTGVVMSGGVKFDGTLNVLFHPSTGKKVVGMQIPNWDAVIRTVKEAGKIPKDLRYIGWDIAVTEDGCELIEMNAKQGSNGMQLDGVGKFPIIREMY